MSIGETVDGSGGKDIKSNDTVGGEVVVKSTIGDEGACGRVISTFGDDVETCGGVTSSRMTVGVLYCRLGGGGLDVKSIVDDDGLTGGGPVTLMINVSSIESLSSSSEISISSFIKTTKGGG